MKNLREKQVHVKSKKTCLRKKRFRIKNYSIERLQPKNIRLNFII